MNKLITNRIQKARHHTHKIISKNLQNYVSEKGWRRRDSLSTKNNDISITVLTK
jgi:hypothetical protein